MAVATECPGGTVFVDDHPIVVTRVVLLTFVRHCKRVKVLTLDFRTCTIAISERERGEWTILAVAFPVVLDLALTSARSFFSYRLRPP